MKALAATESFSAADRLAVGQCTALAICRRELAALCAGAWARFRWALLDYNRLFETDRAGDDDDDDDGRFCGSARSFPSRFYGCSTAKWPDWDQCSHGNHRQTCFWPC